MTKRQKSQHGSVRVTKRWIRNASDERAAAEGYWFDEARGQFVCDWIEAHCCLYEGVPPGTPFTLGDWQRECTMRIFGWVGWSDDWARITRRFRKASIWLPKKNGKSPTLAAWGLYLFIGDGEPGQKIYSAARDGKQALIAHRHAMRMVEMSPKLFARCGKPNQSSGLIFDKQTLSQYMVLAGDNFKSQEGLNGCILIDETHVVDRRLAQVVEFAGASRSEPLQIEVSTAGNDPDGYGREQYDRGKRIEAGDLYVPDFFFQCYEAPQTTQPEHLDNEKTLLKLGKSANPSWGRIIKEGEFLKAYRSSSDSRSRLLNFLMYRLNVWQQSTNPWLSLDHWRACQQPLGELDGKECWAALDLATVRDMNALCLCFPDEGLFKLMWWFWLPEETAKQHKSRIAFDDWSVDPRCHLDLTPGSAVQHEAIMKTFQELAQRYRIRELVYDPHAAELVTRAISEGMELNSNVLFAGTGVPRSEFYQAKAFWTEPTMSFERLVMEHRIAHNGDPIMSWQIGHCAIDTNSNGEVKPVKPGGKDDIRKIDGVIAGIMALKAAMTAQGEVEELPYYENHSLVIL